MRTVFGRPLYRITEWSAAASALWSQSDYQEYKQRHLPRRNAGRPGEKFLCWTHCECNSSMYVPITRATAKAAGTTVRSLMKAYPADWYEIGVRGVSVRFPDAIRYGVDLVDKRLMG